MDFIKSQFQESLHVLNVFMASEEAMLSIEKGINLMVDALRNGNKIISCGNGGSMSDAMHFAEELSGRYRNDRKPLAAVSISDPTHISCVANDYGYDEVFARYVEALGNDGDVLVAISTSGNSANVIKAAEMARSKGLKVIGLTGKDGGKLASLCDAEIRAPFAPYADRAQEIHIKVIHCFIGAIEKELA